MLVNDYTLEDKSDDEVNGNDDRNDTDDDSSDQHITPAERFEPLRSRQLSLMEEQFNENNGYYSNRQQHSPLEEEGEDGEDNRNRIQYVWQYASDVSNAPTLDSAESSYVYQFRRDFVDEYDAMGNKMEEKIDYCNNDNSENNSQATGESSVFTFTTPEPSRENFNGIGDAMMDCDGKIHCDPSWTVFDEDYMQYADQNSTNFALGVQEPDNVFKSFSTVHDTQLITGQTMSSLIEVSPTTASISPAPSSTRVIKNINSDFTPTQLYTCYPPFTTDKLFTAQSTDAIMYNNNENESKEDTPCEDDDECNCNKYNCKSNNNDDDNSVGNNMSQYTNNGITSSTSDSNSINNNSFDCNIYSREVRHAAILSDPVTVSSMTMEDELFNNNNNNSENNDENECVDGNSDGSNVEHVTIRLSSNSETLPENKKSTNQKLFTVNNNIQKKKSKVNTKSNRSTDHDKTNMLREQQHEKLVECERNKNEQISLSRKEETNLNVDLNSQLTSNMTFEEQGKRAAMRLITLINELHSEQTDTFALLTRELQHEFVECIDVIESTFIPTRSSSSLSSSSSSSYSPSSYVFPTVLHLKPDV